MCGRFTLTAETLDLVVAAQQLAPAVFGDIAWRPRFNIAPTQEHPILHIDREEIAAQTARWGLVNRWAKHAKRAARQINARSETVHESRAYAKAFQRRRCVVPADGWYEWSGPKDARQPHWMHRADGQPFLFAGLYEAWYPQPDQPQTTFTILTTDANDALASVHARMPVTVPQGHLERWLDPHSADLDALSPILRPAPDDAFVSRAVSPRVNSVRNDDPSLLDPFEQPTLDALRF